jgi:hypothetical protein
MGGDKLPDRNSKSLNELVEKPKRNIRPYQSTPEVTEDYFEVKKKNSKKYFGMIIFSHYSELKA